MTYREYMHKTAVAHIHRHRWQTDRQTDRSHPRNSSDLYVDGLQFCAFQIDTRKTDYKGETIKVFDSKTVQYFDPCIDRFRRLPAASLPPGSKMDATVAHPAACFPLT